MHLHMLTSIILLSMSEIQPTTQSKSYHQTHTNIQSTNLTNPEATLKESTIFHQDQNHHTEDKKQAKDIDYSDPQIRTYFQVRASINDRNKSMAIGLTTQKVMQLKNSIQQGYIPFPQTSKSIQEIVNRSSPIAKEEEKLNQYMQQKSKLEKQLKWMEDAIQGVNNAPEESNSKSPKRREGSSLSPQEHKKFIERITSIKKQIEERRKIKAEYEENRTKQLQKKEEEAEKERQQKLLSQKQSQAKERLQAIVKRREKMKQEELQSKKRFKSVTEKKRLHEQMEEQYQKSMFLPMIEQRNKILSERSKQLHSIKIEEIVEYQKQYLKNRQQRQSNSRSKIDWDYKHPAYSSKMIKILEEEKINEKIKQQQEKRRIEELKSRQESYKQYLKERFNSVRIDQKKRLEISKIISKEKSVKEGLPKASLYEMGNKYLSEAKTKIKSIDKDKKQSLSTNEQAAKKAKIRQSYKVKPSTSMSNYESSTSSQIKASKIDKIISSNCINQNQKVQKLQIQVEKLTEKAQRKEILSKHNKKTSKADEQDLENLLSSIKAKMSIIELYKK